MRYFDAHCHLQDERIVGELDDIAGLYERLGVAEVVVNGTSEEDWEAVAQLCQRHAGLRPSFGLHPWEANDAGEDWMGKLSVLWDRFPTAGVGEIGLDRWVEGFDLEVQEPAFLWQLREAKKRGRPVSIHCLRAWGRLMELLRAEELSENGFLLHSYGGPMEMVQPFVRLGAYFSISGYFALERKEKQRRALLEIPLDRLLIETDAPDMKGPTCWSEYSFERDETLNHPANITSVYGFVSELFGVSLEALADQVEENYLRFFDTR